MNSDFENIHKIPSKKIYIIQWLIIIESSAVSLFPVVSHCYRYLKHFLQTNLVWQNTDKYFYNNKFVLF